MSYLLPDERTLRMGGGGRRRRAESMTRFRQKLYLFPMCLLWAYGDSYRLRKIKQHMEESENQLQDMNKNFLTNQFS